MTLAWQERGDKSRFLSLCYAFSSNASVPDPDRWNGYIKSAGGSVEAVDFPDVFALDWRPARLPKPMDRGPTVADSHIPTPCRLRVFP